MGGLALVVDAEGDVRRAAEAARFTVTTATTGEQALFEYGQHFFDVALVALRLPGMSGIDVCRELRRRARTPIVVASDGKDRTWLHALEAGADDHIRVPCEPYELRARTDAVARRWRGSLAPARTVRVGSAEIRIVNGTAELPAAWPLEEVDATLLAVLCERPGVAVSGNALAERVAAKHGPIDAELLSRYMDRLHDVLARNGVAVQRTPGGSFRVGPNA